MPLPGNLRRINRPTARMLVFRQLRDWIEDGTLEPGEVIKDVEIAERLGVSRMPVREALQMLEQLGAIETEPGRRTRVAASSPSDASLIYPPLAALQAVAAELAAEKVTEVDLDELRRTNERLLDAISRGDAHTARDADDAFHGSLVRLAGNPYLTSSIESLRLHSRRLDTAYFTHLSPSRTSHEEHSRIIDALAEGDTQLVRELTRKNFVRPIAVFTQAADCPVDGVTAEA